MSSESGKDGFSRDRAELFEALGHPTRIRMLQALAEAPLGFSNLKKTIGIESSGQLQFHLGKMNGLVKNTPEGNYALTDQGREALRIVVVQPRPEDNPLAKAGRRRKRIIAALAVLLAFSIAINAGMAVYAQTLQFTISMEDLRFERFRIVNLWLFETEEGTTYIGFNWEAYCRNPAASPLDFRFEDIIIGIELESANCSVGIGLIQSRNPSISNPIHRMGQGQPAFPSKN